jgi:hypothetical protein
MESILWSITTLFADKKVQIDTLLFGTLEDDCHGTILLKVLVVVINFLLGGVILGGTIGIIVSGLQIIAARDDANMVAKGKLRIINVGIGIAAFVLMYVVLNFIIPGGITLDSEILASTQTCPEPPSTTSTQQPPEGTNPEDPSNPDPEHGVRPFVMCGMTFNVIKIQVNGVKDDGSNSTGLKKYLKEKVQAYHINQSDGKLYNLTGNFSSSNAQNGHCDIVSRNMAYDMYFDTLTSDSCSTGRYDRSAGFSTVTGDSNFKKAYDDIMAGKPVVHRVTINEGGANPQRHYAVLVGVKQGADKNNLKNGDFLFVETWGDGVLWNNISGVPGGYKTSSGGEGCHSTGITNRFPYDTYYYVPSSKTGDDTKDCGT